MMPGPESTQILMRVKKASQPYAIPGPYPVHTCPHTWSREMDRSSSPSERAVRPSVLAAAAAAAAAATAVQHWSSDGSAPEPPRASSAAAATGIPPRSASSPPPPALPSDCCGGGCSRAVTRGCRVGRDNVEEVAGRLPAAPAPGPLPVLPPPKVLPPSPPPGRGGRGGASSRLPSSAAARMAPMHRSLSGRSSSAWPMACVCVWGRCRAGRQGTRCDWGVTVLGL